MLKISAISYLNTVPFVYGLQHSDTNNFSMEFDVPAKCAEKLIKNQTDVGIVPVATISLIPNSEILSDYCIGAVGPVKTVILAGHQPLEETRIVYLDSHSRTSVQLVRILDREYWKNGFTYLPLSGLYYNKGLKPGEAAVLIGDKTFGLENKFKFVYDLSGTWFDFTGLPFVFAAWVANKNISEPMRSQFSRALEYGIKHREEAAQSVDKGKYPNVDVEDYLLNVISYDLDKKKREGMKLFLSMIKP